MLKSINEAWLINNGGVSSLNTKFHLFMKMALSLLNILLNSKYI